MPVIPTHVGTSSSLSDYVGRPPTYKLDEYSSGFFYMFYFYMKHYVYILYSDFYDKYYKGYTTQPLIRLG